MPGLRRVERSRTPMSGSARLKFTKNEEIAK